MAMESTGENGNPFDLGKIKQLVKLMRENDLAEIDLRGQQGRVRLRRGAAETLVSTAAAPSRPATAEKADASTPAEKAAPPANAIYITSPVVGTFYRSPSPTEEPYVKVGSRVDLKTTVCNIIAMKVHNEIPAGVVGTIAEILVENDTSVDFGQKLFRVET